MEVFEYRFAFYELGGKEFPLSKFHIWYLNKSQEEKTQKPKEIITPPLVTQINLVVRPGRKTLEWLKSPEPNRKNNIYYFGYGPMALGGIFFLIFAVSITVSYFRSRKKKVDSIDISEFSCVIKTRILSLKESAFEQKLPIKIRNEIFRLLGNIVGIPANISVAKTTSQILHDLEQKQFSEKSCQELKSCLTILEKIIQDSACQDTSEMRRIVNHIMAISEISQACKKHKKFLIF